MDRSFGEHARTPGFDPEACAFRCIAAPARRRVEVETLVLKPRGRRA